jgi:hypothetical protein
MVSFFFFFHKSTLTAAHKDADELVDMKLAALLAESVSSGSDYQQPEKGESESDEGPLDQSDEEVDLEDEEPDTKIKRKKGTKKQKKGLIARDQVTAAVAAISAVPARLGLIAPASARLQAAPAFRNDWPSRGHQSRLGPGLARPGPPITAWPWLSPARATASQCKVTHLKKMILQHSAMSSTLLDLQILRPSFNIAQCSCH